MSGEVFTAGSKLDGQLGAKLEDESVDNAELEQNQDSMRSPLTQVLPFGDDYNPKALSISCGDSFSLVLDEVRNLWAFGKGSHGRLGIGRDENAEEPVRIELKNVRTYSAGCRHGGAITESGDLYTWGFNFYEQRGLGGTDKDKDPPCEVNPRLFGGKVSQISCGYFHTAAIQ